MNSENLLKRLDHLDLIIVHWLACYSLLILRVGMGIVFLWFGTLKFFPGLSPAMELALRTIDVLTFGIISRKLSLILLASLEVVIGMGFLTGKYLRLTLALLAFHTVGTLTPLALFPAEAFVRFPYVPTLEGQYIIKNLIQIGAGLVIGSTVRGGQILAERRKRHQTKTSPLVNSRGDVNKLD